METVQPFSIAPQAMGMVLWNPTEEDFHMQYAGQSLTMKPGEKTQFEINCAKHLLNGFGRRGLTSLLYGCDEEKVGAEARERNHEFKLHMVVDYNQRNENRKQAGLGYHPPTATLKGYAKEMGLQLLQPYAVPDSEKEAMNNLRRENTELKEQMSNLMSKFELLMGKVNGNPEPAARINEPKSDPGKERNFTCPTCRKGFERRDALTDHMRVHGDG